MTCKLVYKCPQRCTLCQMSLVDIAGHLIGLKNSPMSLKLGSQGSNPLNKAESMRTNLPLKMGEKNLNKDFTKELSLQLNRMPLALITDLANVVALVLVQNLATRWRYLH